MSVNWGTVSWTKENGYQKDPLVAGDGDGFLEEVSDSLKEAIAINGAKMDDLISSLKTNASDPSLLAEYQVVFAQWQQANQLRASAVQKAAETATEILRKL